MPGKDIDLVHPSAPGFVDKVTPKTSTEGLFLFKCTKQLPKPANEPPKDPDYPANVEVEGGATQAPAIPTCGNIHYRHAGYATVFLPFMKPGGQKEIIAENRSVMVCTKCRSCYVWDGSQMFNITDQVDLEAWEKLEKEMHKATGPGGQC